MKTRSLRIAILAAVLAPLFAIATASPAGAATTYYIARDGSGSSCTSNNPCGSFEAALGVARPGDTVRIRPGVYPEQDIEFSVPWDGDDANILFRPDSGSVTIDGIRSHIPSLTFLDLNVSGVLFMHTGGHSNVAVNNTIELAFVSAADNTAWIGNTIKPKTDGPDAMQIKASDGDNPVGITIVGNTFGPQWRSGNSHTDCIQILGGDDILIQANVFFPCADKALQIRSGVGGTIGTVRIIGNFISECSPRRDECNGYHAAIIAAEGNTIEVTHNSINGSVAFSESGSLPNGDRNVSFHGNIATGLPCTSDTDYNLVESGKCGSHDIIGTPDWVDDAELVQDLHLVSGSKGLGAGSPYAPSVDIDGQSCTTGDIGADQVCGSGGSPTPIPPGPGSPTPVSPVSGELTEAISWMYGAGITTEGPNVDQFDANGSTTRGQAVTFLHRSEKEPVGSGSTLPDVSSDRFFAGAVKWATGAGIVTGFPDGTFRPDAAVTRGQFAVMLFRMAGSPSTPLASISDVNNGSFYAEAVAWAQDVGVMNGYGNGQFGPEDQVTRGQVALMMCRFSGVESLAVGRC